MRHAIFIAAMTAALATSAFAQSTNPTKGPKPGGGQDYNTCLADCRADLAKCREPGKTNGIPAHCAPDYNACVKTCK